MHDKGLFSLVGLVMTDPDARHADVQFQPHALKSQTICDCMPNSFDDWTRECGINTLAGVQILSCVDFFSPV